MTHARRTAPLSRRKRLLFGLSVALCSTVLAAALAEVGLRLYADWRARNLPDYGDAWRTPNDVPLGLGLGGYLKENFDAQVMNGYGGTVRWTNNSQGFRNDRDFTPAPPPGVLRILSLGDSFTAGYRVGQQDIFSRRLEVWSEQRFGPTQVLVSCIEQPLTALHYLERYGERWMPHLVLLGVTLGNDIAQTHSSLNVQKQSAMFGPQAMFLPDYSHTGPIPAPALWQRSHFLRLLMGSRRGITYQPGPYVRFFDPGHSLGLYLRRTPHEARAAFESLFQVLKSIAEWCRSRRILFAATLFPLRIQVQPADWRAALRDLALKEDEFDLMLPNRTILEFCRRASIPCLDPTDEMQRIYRETGSEQYLPNRDMHWNAEGHRAFLQAVKGELAPILSEARLSLKAEDFAPRRQARTAASRVSNLP